MAPGVQPCFIMKYKVLVFSLLFSFAAQAEVVEIKTSSGRLNVRRQPGLNTKACNAIASGQKFEKLDEKNGWVQIKVRRKGCPSKVWIHAYYTKDHYRGEITKQELLNWKPNTSVTNNNNPVDTSGETTQASEDTAEVRPHYPASVSTGGGAPSELADGQGSPQIIGYVQGLTDPTLPTRPSGLTDTEYNLCQFYDNDRKMLDQNKTKNCYELIKKANNGQLPKKALIYSLKYLKANLGQLQDSRCLAAGGTKGIKNSCQFILNDLNSRVKNFPNRSPSYFIDLCDGGDKSAKKGLVYKTYINRGTGSQKNSYADTKGRNTTTAGAFITGALTPFIPYRVTKAYKNLGWSRCFQKDSRGRILTNRPVKNMAQCPVTRLALYGAHSSNNSTSKSKPMHVSPYKSSWGCPSVGLDDRWMMDTLHKNGPSLVMNYGPERLHKDSSINSCKNE